MLKIPAPRLLPATIATMGGLLLLKCCILLQAVMTNQPRPDSLIVTAANAAGTETPKERVPDERTNPTEGSLHKATPSKAAAIVPESPMPPKQDGPPAVSDSERALLQDLRQRRRELDARAATIAAHESILAAAEQKLAARVSEMQALQKRLEGLDVAQKQKEDSGWQGLVKMYEAMKPKDAATIFNDLSMSVVLPVMDRMKDSKAALVMAAMNPDKARDVTAELAQLRTGQNSAADPKKP